MGAQRNRAMRSLHMVAFNKLFEDLSLGVGLLGTQSPAAWRPPTDVFECDDAYIVRMALSGLKRTPDGDIKNASITVENDILIVRGHREDDCPRRKHSFFQMEINYGPFECCVRIHAPFDRENIRAEYRDGFLIITIPKSPEIKPGVHTVRVRD